MLDSVRDLLILQDRDQRITRLQKELDNHPIEEARANAHLAGDTASLKDASDAVKAAELRVKKVEMNAETRRTSIQRLQTQQFETRKNEEFNALGHEIERYKREVDELETQELEAMEEVDGLRVKQKAAEAVLAKTQGVVNDDLVAIKQRHIEKQAQLEEVKLEREKLVLNVDEEMIPLYEKLMRSKDGKAIATLHAGKCTGCNIKVIAATLISLHQEKEITQCENCGRILSVDE